MGIISSSVTVASVSPTGILHLSSSWISIVATTGIGFCTVILAAVTTLELDLVVVFMVDAIGSYNQFS